MKIAESFHSTNYLPINWKDIFHTAGSAVLCAATPLGMINSTGLVMTTDVIFKSERVSLCFMGGVIEEMVCDLVPMHFTLLKQTGVFYFTLNSAKRSVFLPSPLYENLIFEVLRLSYDACKKIFLYTYEHLKNREYNATAIINIDSVQQLFSDIMIAFEKINILMNAQSDLAQHLYVIDILVESLHTLAKLGGARAVLKSNAIDLMFHLKIFQKYLIG